MESFITTAYVIADEEKTIISKRQIIETSVDGKNVNFMPQLSPIA